jgi:hypothetical protein
LSGSHHATVVARKSAERGLRQRGPRLPHAKPGAIKSLSASGSTADL